MRLSSAENCMRASPQLSGDESEQMVIISTSIGVSVPPKGFYGPTPAWSYFRLQFRRVFFPKPFSWRRSAAFA
jgi:hypothetical protein